MKTLKTYLYGELASPEARLEAEAGSYRYAAGMVMQQNNCPAHLLPKMHQTFLDEYLGGYFDESGMCRFPAGVFPKEKGDGAASAVPAGEAPKLEVIEGGSEKTT